MITSTVPGALSSTLTVMAVTWKRLVRGRTLWVAGLIALKPIVFAAVLASYHVSPQSMQTYVLTFEQPLLVTLSAMFIAASIGEDIEDRTTTYLWSRPIPRWVVLAGKLATLIPVIIVLAVASWYLAVRVGTKTGPSVGSCIALGAGTITLALVASGIATLAPRHGMALTIGYLALIDLSFGYLPLSIRNLSVTFQQRALLEALDQTASAPDPTGSAAGPAIALALLGGTWLAVALLRIRRLEA